jgi:hypothetical protein
MSKKIDSAPVTGEILRFNQVLDRVAARSETTAEGLENIALLRKAFYGGKNDEEIAHGNQCVVCGSADCGRYGKTFPVCYDCVAEGRLTKEHIARYLKYWPGEMEKEDA